MEPTVSLDLVPPAYLEPPAADELRHLLRDEAAELIDGYLRRLARQEALCRRVLGSIAARLLDTRAHHDLGFARLSDYTRERLGLSGREVQLLARVARRLESLPLLADAFARGQLNWTKLRLLAEVASADDEHVWLELSHGANATDLARRITEHCGAQRPPAAGGDGARTSATPSPHDGVDDEPRVRVKLTCPRRIAAMWRLACETARKVAGYDLCEWQAAEAIAAEGMSAAAVGDLVDRREHDHQPGSTRRREDASAKSAHDVQTLGYGEIGGDPFQPRDLEALRRALDWTDPGDLLPPRVEALADDVDHVTAHELDARLRATLRAMQRTDWQLGRLLRTFFNLRLHLHVGFPTTAAYITDRLGMSVRKARGLYRLESHCLRGGLGLTAAYSSGRVSWCRAHALLPVLTDVNADAWIERAGRVTLRRLLDEIAWARDVQDTTPGAAAPAPPPLGAALDIDRYGPAMQFGAHGAGASSLPHNAGTTDVDTDIVFSAPRSVALLLQDAIDAFGRPGQPSWNGLLQLLIHALDTWQALPTHRDRVFARDGWRCRAPACSSRRNLQAHHVVFRSRGGCNRLSNRVAVCAWHHLRGIHTGRVRARHAGRGRIGWDLGCRADGRALVQTVDDAYLPVPPPGLPA